VAAVMKRVEGGCPDLETIAAYLDGRLSERERARVTEHLASCEECYAVFSESAQTPPLEALSPARGQGWRARLNAPRVIWPSAAAVLVAAAAVVLFVGTGGVMPWRQGQSELRALVAAAGTDRFIEARLAGGFAYGPVRGPVRAGRSTPPAVSPDVRIAAAAGEKALAGVGSPGALHTLGVASLILGDIDRAIPTLERAVEPSSPDARFLSDLSAAYLARATRDGHHQDLVKALAAADRAVKANPMLVEALYNRALALERLSLRDEARTAWDDYLSEDNQSGWADEARLHLSALR
jgi:tetratricopeptide (TPR) repeat protein